MSEPAIYFDDLNKGDVFTFGPYRVDRGEMLAFSIKWDPLPIHVDEEFARKCGHRDITASGQYTLCVKQALMTQAPWRKAVIGAMGFDELRFPCPVYADDALTLTIECIDTRPSRSKPDRGIVKFTFKVHNQNRETVLSYVDTVMFARRGDGAADPGPAQPVSLVPESQALTLASELAVMKRNGVDQAARIAYIADHLGMEPGAAEQVHVEFEAGFTAGVNAAVGMPSARAHTPADETFHAIASQLGTRDMQAMMEEEQERKARRKRRANFIAVCICVGGAALVAALFFMV